MDKQKVRRAPRLLGRAASIAVRLWNEEHLHRLLVGTRRFVLCALLMQANVFDSYAPFGLAMASAMMAHGAGLSAVGGVVCGAMLIDDGLLGGVYVAATLIVLCVMSVCTGLRVVQRPWFAPAVAAAPVCRAPHLYRGRAARPGCDDLSRRAGTDVRRVPHLRRGARSAA